MTTSHGLRGTPRTTDDADKTTADNAGRTLGRAGGAMLGQVDWRRETNSTHGCLTPASPPDRATGWLCQPAERASRRLLSNLICVYLRESAALKDK
jgi:hypothetical protein